MLLGDISSCACAGVDVVDCSGGAGGLAASAESRSMLERQFSDVMGTGGKVKVLLLDLGLETLFFSVARWTAQVYSACVCAVTAGE